MDEVPKLRRQHRRTAPRPRSQTAEGTRGLRHSGRQVRGRHTRHHYPLRAFQRFPKDRPSAGEEAARRTRDRGETRESAAPGECGPCAAAPPSDSVAEHPASTSCRVRASPRSAPEHPARGLRPRGPRSHGRTCTESDLRSTSCRLSTSCSKYHGAQAHQTSPRSSGESPTTLIPRADTRPDTTVRPVQTQAAAKRSVIPPLSADHYLQDVPEPVPPSPDRRNRQTPAAPPGEQPGRKPLPA